MFVSPCFGFSKEEEEKWIELSLYTHVYILISRILIIPSIPQKQNVLISFMMIKLDQV